jgi:superfamily II DNA or RNA helicase
MAIANISKYQLPNEKMFSNIAKLVYNESFEDYFEYLYEHQQKAYDAMNDVNIGQIICPTGSGKSKIQIATIFKHLEDNPGEIHNYVIASHRLLLNLQLISNLVTDVKKSVAPFRILFVGSGNITATTVTGMLPDDMKVHNDDVLSTTKKSEIDNYIKSSNKKGYDVLIVSTYHSLDKLSNVDIEIACFDEAHTTASSRDEDPMFKANIKKLKKAKRKYFFTATRKVFGDEKGMNDSFYGEVIYSIPPKTIIDGGYICEPKLHLVYNKENKTGEVSDLRNYKMEVKTILESFTAHNQIVKSNAERAGMLPPMAAKMLVNTPGAGNMKAYIKSKELKNYSKNNKCKMFFISANKDVDCLIIDNGVVIKNIDREKWMGKLTGLEQAESAIIFHFSILTEGIDLPNITGTLFTRATTISKLMQSVGRSLRLLPEDRQKLFVDGTLLPAEKEKFFKPYGYVILPSGFLIEEDDEVEMEKLIRTVVNEYHIPEQELTLVTTDANGTKTIDIDDIGTGLEDPRDKRLSGVISEIYHEIGEATSKLKYEQEHSEWILEMVK